MQRDQREQEIPTLLPFRSKVEAGVLGAAVGDALGWPQEGRASRSTTGNAATTVQGQFAAWKHRAGGRFYAHEEEIKAGEYSDDTQLIIATSRSLLESDDWYRVLTQVELPLWTAYSRGGGGATKRAAAAWLSGKPPWETPAADQRKYFEAGGNGVVMRILPHCVWGAKSASFEPTGDSIVRNGIATHGHPRALIGALAYGFAAWHQLRSSEILGYGALLELLFDANRVWSTFPEHIDVIETWLQGAALNGTHYRDLWLKTVDEQLSLLKTAKAGLSKGALAVDQEVLNALGCFDKRVSGSGTIAAAAAIFLTSRFAADPMNGICEAAYSLGADTDTLASLAGALLGLVNGDEWLGSLANEVQDSAYLRALARDLCEGKPVGGISRTRVTEAGLTKFLSGLPTLANQQSITLPDGQHVTVHHVMRDRLSNGTTEQVTAHFKTSSGQNMRFSKFLKSASKGSAAPQRSAEGFDPVRIDRVVVRLQVRDLEEAKRFYVGALGLKVTKQAPGLVTLADVLALSSREPRPEQLDLKSGTPDTEPMHVYIETKDLETAHSNLQRTKAMKLSEITRGDNRRRFTCCDPENNFIEVFESRR
jgi:ADP-ribosylglycohydrolase/predicted enzyme related to lactoylglutathione lyase